MGCVVCGDETLPRRELCAKHLRIIDSTGEEFAARREALQRAWNPEKRLFECEYTGIELLDTDPHNPFNISFDHCIPGKKNDLKLTFRALNQIKSSFSWDEFVKIVLELDAHFDGKPFDRDVVEYLYWRPAGKAPPAEPARAGRAGPVRAKKAKPCVVCGLPTRTLYYCDRCRRLVQRTNDRLVKRKALQESWDRIRQRFICYWTGIELEEVDWKSPHFVSFDHLTPGVKEPQVACANWVNRMKTMLTEDGFRIFVRELARFLRGEGPFRKKKLRFEDWYMR